MAIPTEPIGSIPRPAQLIGAGQDLAAGRITVEAYAELAEAAVRQTIAELEATGSPVITDGEQGKPSFATYPVAGLEALASDGAVILFADGHTRQLPRPGVLGDGAQDAGAVRLAGQLDVEGASIQAEQAGQQCGVVDVGAVGGVLVAARAGMHADPLALLGGELLKHLVVQIDERTQQLPGRVELDGEPALGEVDLHAVRAAVQGAADVGGRLVHQVCQERLPRVAVDAAGRVDQAQRGRSDHRLLDRDVGIM